LSFSNLIYLFAVLFRTLSNQNNKLMKKVFLLLSFLFCSFLLFAQQLYTLTITDGATGNPLPNASAKVKSASKGVIAGSDGLLKIQANVNDVIEVSSIGYKPQSFALGNQTTITVAMDAVLIELGDIVILGTRGAGRAKIETAVPVDVIKINQAGLPTAKMDLSSVLNMAAPSFNYNKQSGADGADHIDLGTLRGLGPDQTLVLINGKRRHTTALVALFGTRGKGASGTDLNAFPQSAIDRIEILRDGASAQYGSDAIAGVINIILKKDVNHWAINTGWAGFYDTKFNTAKFNAGNEYVSGNKIDGQTFTLSATNGFALGKNDGFVSIALNVLTQGKTYRQVDTANWKTDKNALPFINTGRRAFGDGSLKTFGASYNMELPVKDSKTVFYSFATFNNKASDAYAYSRNYSEKPERFPADASGNLLFDAAVMRTTKGGEIYYNPHIQTKINDASLAAGFKGITGNNWNWDFSNTIGRNDFHYYGDKTFNASIIGDKSKTHFDDGGFNFLQNTTNLDFSKSFNTVAEGLNIALGAEFRYEKYSIYKGENSSYESFYKDTFYYASADEYKTPATGSQGFPGFSNSDVINKHRSNFSGYADAELNITKKWLLDIAIRFENYSDFGFVNTSKIATRYKAADNFNFRGSISTGFRAPSLQQINFSNTLTSFSAGELVQSRITRNGDNVTKAAGIGDLKQETSINTSIGFAWKAAKNLTITVDGYAVKVKDRIVLSGLFSADDPTLPAAFTNQLKAIKVSTAQFFDNAVNTTNLGLDVVADYTKKWGNKSFKALLAGNFQKMKIDQINVPAVLNTTKLNANTFYTDREQAFLLASAPKLKFNLNMQYDCNKFGFGTHITAFGPIKLLGFGDGSIGNDNPNYAGINPQVSSDADGTPLPEQFNYKTKIVTDVFISYKISTRISVFAGADNVFNAHPDLGVNQKAKSTLGYNDNENGGPWDSVQMGFNGRRLFTKLSFNF
jgi:iron complex outermembrane recepter protein